MTKLTEETRSYVEQIVELSQFVSSRGNWSEIREVIERAGHDPNHVFLVGFMEGEEGEEYGTIVATDDKVFSWFRNTNQRSSAEWREITDVAEEIADEPAIRVAIDRRHEILRALTEGGYR